MTQPRTEYAHVQSTNIIAIEDEKWPEKSSSALAGLELATLRSTFFFRVERLFCLAFFRLIQRPGKVAEW